MDATSENEFPKALEFLDESLRCKICDNRYHAAVSISDRNCGHSFCSECIRNTFNAQLKTLKRERKCPICRFVVKTNVDNALVPNRPLQEAVQAFEEFLTQYRNENNGAKTEVQVATPSPAVRALRSRNSLNYKEAAYQATEVEVEKSGDCDVILKKKPMPIYNGKSKKKLQELVCTNMKWLQVF